MSGRPGVTRRVSRQDDGVTRPGASAVETAPMPERRLCSAMLKGLDLGRSSAMNRWMTENGKQSAIFAVCAMFWLLAAFVVAVVAVATQLTIGAPASVVLWAAFAATFALVATRYGQSIRARRHFRETESDAA